MSDFPDRETWIANAVEDLKHWSWLPNYEEFIAEVVDSVRNSQNLKLERLIFFTEEEDPS